MHIIFYYQKYMMNPQMKALKNVNGNNGYNNILIKIVYD